MGSIFFAIKSLVITVVVILMLQIKVGPHTLEYRLNQMVRTSGVHEPAQQLADGIVRFVRNTWRGLTDNVGTELGHRLKGDSAPGKRHTTFNFDRSAEYLKEKADKAKNQVESHLREEGLLEDTYTE